jgi:hypothetical protein
MGSKPLPTPTPKRYMFIKKYVTVFRYIRMMKASMNLFVRLRNKRKYTKVAMRGGTNSNIIVKSVRSSNAIVNYTSVGYTEVTFHLVKEKGSLDIGKDYFKFRFGFT